MLHFHAVQNEKKNITIRAVPQNEVTGSANFLSASRTLLGSVQDGIYALGKAHMRSIPFLSNITLKLPNI